MSEFTGERVIPGQVEPDLWAEHIARYRFAAQFAGGKRVLDLGCGTGYGTAELAQVAREATGIDNSMEAIAYASLHYPHSRFFPLTATELPFPDGSFDLITAFEIIEHLNDWPRLLSEARRVLTPEGILLVSTPNKLYYAEARAEAGPNPFHAHEFEYEEFRAALTGVFAHVRLLVQDRTEAFAFYDAPGQARGEFAASGSPPESNFFIGVCSQAPLPDLHPFVYVPQAANLLRERERHIVLLETELAQVRTWLNETTASRDALHAEHEAQTRHLDHQNQWARELETNWHAAEARITQLQTHLETEQARAAAIIADLNEENRRKTEWALDTEKRLTTDIDQLRARLQEAETTIEERTRWAQDLDAQLAALHNQLALVRDSRWIKLGRSVGVGPKL